MLTASNNKARKQKGAAAEQAVALFLQKHNYTILARNFTKRYGEIDLIAQNAHTIAFVEVKMRVTNYFALSQVVTPSKQRKIALTAKAFIREAQLQQSTNFRFDVALVYQEKIEYIRNAFCIKEY